MRPGLASGAFFSRFVASFIGSPPMNLLKNAPDAKPGLITGIRPEHLDITPTGWALQVEAVEMLGAERLIYGKWAHKLHAADADELLIIRTEESAAVPALGATLHVTPRPDRIHHFDAGTGKRVETP